MTTTITPEERASEAISAYFSGGSDSQTLQDLIAAAIRDAERCAENAAYERAADAVLHHKVMLGDQPTASWNAGYSDGYLDACDAAAIAINRLKSPSPKDQGHE